MALIEEFEKSGGWLFRWRSYLPLVFIALYLFVLWQYSPHRFVALCPLAWDIFSVFVGFFGLLIRFITIGYTPRGTSGRNTKKQIAESLNTLGIYSLVRNPLYLGNFLMGLAVVLLFPIWWMILIYTLVFWIYYERIIFVEEAFLRDKFGDVYLKWSEKTPAFIPRFGNYQKNKIPFSTKNAIKREDNGFFGYVFVMSFVKFLGDYFQTNLLEFELWWMVFLAVGFVLWICLRFIRKSTKFFSVEGR